MNRAQKSEFVEDLSKGLTEAETFALLSFNKLTVEQMTSFRLALIKKEIRVKVVKNTLAKRVFETTKYKALSEHLKGPTLVAYGKDPIVTAKTLMEWAKKENFDIKVKAGVALGDIISSAQLETLSKLPGRNEMFVSFLWALKSHPTRFLYALQDSPRRLGYALGALKEKREKESQ